MNIEKIINTNEERQKFIKWAARNHYDVSEITTSHSVLFKRQSTTDAWMGWLYSAKDKAEKLEGCVVVPVEMPDSFDDALYMYSNDISVVNSESDGFIPMADLDHGKVWQLMVEAARGGNE
ncbi:hypothetical protein [Acinetobacter haemolyticus]